MPPVIALLTDFGTRDPYVGIMQGVILTRAANAVCVTLTHEIEPGDVAGGALALLAAAEYFPKGTIFLAVVDPGVGGERRPLCLRSGGCHWVGPDNGLLWPAAAALGTPAAFQLASAAHRLPRVSRTFHGRDLFAPAAAALANGVPAEALGPPISDPVRLHFPEPAERGGRVVGEVLAIDRFGNAITNLRPEHLGDPAPGEAVFTVKRRTIRGPVTHYGAVPAGELLAIVGSLDRYEIAVNRGSAAERLGLRRGDRVAARRR